MKNIEYISAINAERIEDVGNELAETYKVAFAGEPWFEVSRCINNGCETGFSSLESGCECPQCKDRLVPAYETNELLNQWRSMLENENALFEIAFDGDRPQRATIARPTSPAELFVRKYADVSGMRDVLSLILPKRFVWIEDTFANRERVPNGNLRERGKTIASIADYYGQDLVIATRTLASGIIRATLRDMLLKTVVYLGSDRAGEAIVNQAFANPGYELPTIPDRRTLLIIKNMGGYDA